MRVAHIVVGILAVALTACGGIGVAASGSSTSRSPSPNAGRGNAAGSVIAGKLSQVTASRLVVTEPAGDVTVGYAASTTVLKTSAGSATDIAAGACVTATGQKDATGGVVANMVQLQFNMNGNCNPQGGGSQASPPGGGQGLPSGQGLPANAAFARGKITAVNGASFTVQSANGGSTVTVTVPATARITKLESGTTSQLAVGQCVRVNGRPDANAIVQARAVTVVPANADGSCPAGNPGRPGRGVGQGQPTPA